MPAASPIRKTMKNTLQKTKPHCESMLPYGYRFENIDLIIAPNFKEALDLFIELRDEHFIFDIQIGRNHPLRDQIIWSIAAHIEGNFGMPYKALIVYSEEHEGTISIYVKNDDKWWKDAHIRRQLSSYLMGMRSIIWMVKNTWKDA